MNTNAPSTHIFWSASGTCIWSYRGWRQWLGGWGNSQKGYKSGFLLDKIAERRFLFIWVIDPKLQNKKCATLPWLLCSSATFRRTIDNHPIQATLLLSSRRHEPILPSLWSVFLAGSDAGQSHARVIPGYLAHKRTRRQAVALILMQDEGQALDSWGYLAILNLKEVSIADAGTIWRSNLWRIVVEGVTMVPDSRSRKFLS